MDLLNLLSSTTTDDHWMDRAQCLTTDPNVLQPERATEAEVAEAKGICRGCPVFEDCLAHAEAQSPAYGVHAGQWWGDPPVFEVVKVCVCGASFRAERDTLAGQRATYCSTECQVEARRQRDAERRSAKRTACLQCAGQLPEGRTKFCRKGCSQAHARNAARGKVSA